VINNIRYHKKNSKTFSLYLVEVIVVKRPTAASRTILVNCIGFTLSWSFFQESNIEQVHIGMKAKLPTPELAQLLISLLDQLIQDCRLVHVYYAALAG